MRVTFKRVDPGAPLIVTTTPYFRVPRSATTTGIRSVDVVAGSRQHFDSPRYVARGRPQRRPRGAGNYSAIGRPVARRGQRRCAAVQHLSGVRSSRIGGHAAHRSLRACKLAIDAINLPDNGTNFATSCAAANLAERSKCDCRSIPTRSCRSNCSRSPARSPASSARRRKSCATCASRDPMAKALSCLKIISAGRTIIFTISIPMCSARRASTRSKTS